MIFTPLFTVAIIPQTLSHLCKIESKYVNSSLSAEIIAVLHRSSRCWLF